MLNGVETSHTHASLEHSAVARHHGRLTDIAARFWNEAGDFKIGSLHNVSSSHVVADVDQPLTTTALKIRFQERFAQLAAVCSQQQ